MIKVLLELTKADLSAYSDRLFLGKFKQVRLHLVLEYWEIDNEISSGCNLEFIFLL